MQVTFPKLGLEFTVNSTAFSIGGFTVQWYGIIIAVGLLLAVIYGLKRTNYYRINSDKLMDAIIVGVLCAVVGARLYYVAFEWDSFKDAPWEIVTKFHEGGLAIYGGIIGGLLGGGLVAKKNKINVPACLDISAMGFILGQGIGRWGNFMNQEAFGTHTDLPWGMASVNTGYDTVHPCFLYESLWCLLGFVLLHFFSKKWQTYKGQVFLLYLVWYGFERTIVEGLRTDSLYLPFSVFGMPIRVSQVLSAVLVVIGIILLIVFRKRKDEFGAMIIDGKMVSAKVKDEVGEEIKALKEKGIEACLAVIIVGDNPASRVYVNNKKKACEYTGIKSLEFALPEQTTQEELLSLVNELNERQDVNGILVQLPLPSQIDEKAVIEAIDPKKDVDAFHKSNVGRIMIGDYDFLPCTPAGVMELLKAYDIDPKGKNCVVIGRSNIVGKPMAMLLLHADGTVTVTHSKTANLKKVTSQADILVAAIGKAKFVKANMVKSGAVVIDVGMNKDADGKLCGDVDFDKVKDKVAAITPVPGGVGPMTIAILMKNTLKACKLQNNC